MVTLMTLITHQVKTIDNHNVQDIKNCFSNYDQILVYGDNYFQKNILLKEKYMTMIKIYKKSSDLITMIRVKSIIPICNYSFKICEQKK